MQSCAWQVQMQPLSRKRHFARNSMFRTRCMPGKARHCAAHFGVRHDTLASLFTTARSSTAGCAEAPALAVAAAAAAGAVAACAADAGCISDAGSPAAPAASPKLTTAGCAAFAAAELFSAAPAENSKRVASERFMHPSHQLQCMNSMLATVCIVACSNISSPWTPMRSIMMPSAWQLVHCGSPDAHLVHA